MDVGTGEHGVVFDLRTDQRRAVGGNNDQLGLALDNRFDGGLVAQGAFAALHYQCKFGVDGFNGFLLLLVSDHRKFFS